MAGKKHKQPAKALTMEAKKKAFLAAYGIRGSITEACRIADMHRGTHYDWLANDPAYPGRFAEACAQFDDFMEEEANRRGTFGVPRLKFFHGEMIMIPDPSGKMLPDLHAPMRLNPETKKFEQAMTPALVPYIEHEYSDTLLMFRLRAQKPEKYRENVDVKQSGSVDVNLKGRLTMLPTREEALKRYAELATRLPEKPRPSK